LAATSSRFLDLREYTTYLSLPYVSCLAYSSLIPFVPCRNVKRTLENLSAGDVELSTENLAEIAQLLEKYPRKGARYIDGVEEDKLLLWN
jgi:diketogulonate reductase-like aldo/keto reductase